MKGVLTYHLESEKNTETGYDGQQVRETGLLVPGEHLEEHNVQQCTGCESLQDDGHATRRPVHGTACTVLYETHADDDADGSDHRERGHVHDEHGLAGLGPGQFQADAERDDQLMGGHGDEQIPHVFDALFQPDGQSLEHFVERQGQHGEQAAERVVASERAVRFGLFLGVAIVELMVVLHAAIVYDGHWRFPGSVPFSLGLFEQLLDAGRGRVAVGRGCGRGWAAKRRPRYGHGPPAQAHRPVQHLVGRVVVWRMGGRAPVENGVYHLIDEEDEEEARAKYQVTQVLSARAAGQHARPLEPADALSHFGLQMKQRSEQQHAAAEA